MGTIPVPESMTQSELEHCAQLGFKGKLERYPSGKGYPTAEDDNFWLLRLISKCRSPIIVTAIWDQAGAAGLSS
jgi:hypothetical protein